MKEKLKSRKLWIALIVAILTVLNDQFEWGLTSETIQAIVTTGLIYIVGQAFVDGRVKQNDKVEIADNDRA